MTDDEVVAHEVARLRSLDGPINTLKADLLEQAQVATAAAFLRECALEALKSFDGQRDAWAVSAQLQFVALKEAREQRRRGLGRFPLERLTNI